MIDQKTRSWTAPKTAVRLRLEVRGDGLMGYVDGQPAFSSPLNIPADFELGWVGLTAFNAEKGKGQVALERASAGPLAARLALLPVLKDETETDALLAVLQPESMQLSDLLPRWFRVNSEGVLVNQAGVDEKLLRLFARYYRVRLMPIVEVPADTILTGDELQKAADQYKVDGFVLLFNSLPNKAWFDRIETDLSAAKLKILAIALSADSTKSQIRSLAAGSDLLMGSEDAQDILCIPWIGADGKHAPLSGLPNNKPVHWGP